METPDKEGVTLRNRLEAHERAGGKRPQRLEDSPDFPEGLEYIWHWFLELDSARQLGMAPNPTSWQEMESWMVVNEVRMTPFEVDCIRGLDRARMNHYNERASKESSE